MNTAKVLKENSRLRVQVEGLMDLAETLLNANTQKSEKIEKLLLQQAGINNKVVEIYHFLLSEVRKNDLLQTDSKNAGDMLNVIRILIKALQHDNESKERENKVLRKSAKSRARENEVLRRLIKGGKR